MTEQDIEKLYDKPLAWLTVREFVEILNSKRPSKEAILTKEPEYLRGHKELAKYIGVGTSTISRLRAEGVFDDITIERGKIILYEKGKIMECLNKRGKNRKPYVRFKK